MHGCYSENVALENNQMTLTKVSCNMDNNFASGNMKQSSKAHSKRHVKSQTQVNHTQDKSLENVMKSSPSL
jgi:hypothetical protein